MESDKKSFDSDRINQESSDFLEYQHKKLEKVAEIIKEEERAAKLLEETENAALAETPKTRVVINSIVKHEKPAAEEKVAENHENMVDGLYIEPVKTNTESDFELSLDDHEDIPSDDRTFEAVDEVIQASQNDFETDVSTELELKEDTLSLKFDEETQASTDHVTSADLEHQKYTNEANSAERKLPELDLVDGLAIENPDEIDVQTIDSDAFEPAPEIVTSANLLGDDLEDEVEAEVSDAVVDFAAAEEATEAEAVAQSAVVDYSQPKISKIGKLLLELGKISRSDTKKILRTQKKHGLLFGDAALKLGLINDDDIQKVVAMQFNYHYLQAGQGKFSDDLVAAYAPFSKKVENYRALRSQLMMRWFKKGHRALAVVGANSGDGVSYLTANLGVVFSQLGARTLIIEANMRSPRHQTIFNIRTHSGLSDMIVGKIGRDAIQEIESIPDLSVLHAGTVPPNPQELLGRTSFNILFKNLSEDYDVILIDTPPVVQSADAQSVIEMSEGAMLVSRLHETKHTDVLEMRHLIEMTGASIVSAVMNDF